jgi:hypothetical protein
MSQHYSDVSDKTREALGRINAFPTAAVEDAALAFGVGRSTGYEAARNGEWPTIRVRGRVRIPSAWIRGQLMLTGPTCD